jgi:hypothetical protein
LTPGEWIAGEIKSPVFVVSTEPSGDWIDVKLDISRIGSSPITSIRLDFIGDSPGIGKNFELDYVRLFCTPYDLVPPAKPTGLKAVAGNNQIILIWDQNNEPDLLGYNIYRSNQTGRPPTKYKTGIKLSDYTDMLLSNGVKYVYQISAVDSSGNESAKTDMISAIPGEITATSHLVPTNNSLIQKIYPNPFNNEIILEYSLAQAGNVKFEIFNVSGEKIAENLALNMSAGNNAFFWNGKSDSGKPVLAGIYFCSISTNKQKEVVRLVKKE